MLENPKKLMKDDESSCIILTEKFFISSERPEEFQGNFQERYDLW